MIRWLGQQGKMWRAGYERLLQEGRIMGDVIERAEVQEHTDGFGNTFFHVRAVGPSNTTVSFSPPYQEKKQAVDAADALNVPVKFFPHDDAA